MLSEDMVFEELKKVIDPELFVNIVDLGLIYVVDIKDAEEEGKKDVFIDMTMTSPACPAGPQLISNSKTWKIMTLVRVVIPCHRQRNL